MSEEEQVGQGSEAQCAFWQLLGLARGETSAECLLSFQTVVPDGQAQERAVEV